MQSLLQYRSFGKHVEAQYERDREKAAGTGPNDIRHNQGDSTRLRNVRSETSSGSDMASVKSVDSKDLEKQHDGIPESSPPADDTARHEQNNRQTNLPDEGVSAYDRLTNVPTHTQPISAQTTRVLEPTGTMLGVALTGIQVRTRTTHEGKGDPGRSQKVFIVGFEGEDDPLNPHNWSNSKRIACTFLIASISFLVGIASSIDSSAFGKAAADFGVSEVVESLAVGIFLAGFGVGALFAGPFSETVGRNPVYIVTLFLFNIFIMASALAPNIGAQLAFRFLAGFFGSTPLTCAGGSLSDLWSPMERVFAFPVFANAAFTGPVLGPVMGGFIAQSTAVSWRWTEWTTLIMGGLVLSLVVLFLPETFPPTLLKWKSEHLRRVTGEERYRAEVEILNEPFATRLKRALYRPFLLTIREPIIVLITLYLTVLYIILFTFFDGYDYIFADIHGTSPGITGLCFLGIAAGLCIPPLWVPMIYRWAKRDLAKIQERGGTHLPPEFRLWFAMLGGSIALPVSLFWMGWTSDSNISIWSPLIASVLFGYGTLCVFISSYQYMIDVYESYAASALASCQLIRYCAAGGMTVVGLPFYQNMGVHYTLTILGSLAAALAPLPFVFYKYGRAIRKHSKYAAAKD